MARFNPDDYETVEQRLKRFHTDNPDGRVVTENETTPEDRAMKTWVIRAVVFLNGEDMERACPKATGYAFEIDGVGMSQQTAALETAETSAIGRALANAGYSGNKRASREEMAKAQRGTPTRDWLAEAQATSDVDKVRLLWGEASKAGAPAEVLEQVKAYGERLSADSVGEGTDSGVPGSAKGKRRPAS